MKPATLLQESSQESDKTHDDEMNGHDEDAVDVPDPDVGKQVEEDLNLLQASEGLLSGAQLWTTADANAEVNEKEEQHRVESYAKAQVEAEATAHAKVESEQQSFAAQEVAAADAMSEFANNEQFREKYNDDVPTHIHEHGNRASMDERGYKAVANLKDNAEMEAYIRRACQFMGFAVRDDAHVRGLVPYYSGEKSTQSFESLLLELERNAHDAEEEKWIKPMEEEAEDQEQATEGLDSDIAPSGQSL